MTSVPDIEQLIYGKALTRLMLSVPWTVGLIIYVVGILISLYTRNFERFLQDYPWACFSATIIIGAWASPYLTKRHLRCTNSMRNIYLVSDETFESILKDNMRRLTHPRNLIFGLIFLPALLWALTQRLWWQGYNSPFIFDLYYFLNLAFMFPFYAGLMFGASIACNLNVYRLSEKIPIDYNYLMEEGLPILRRHWGGQLAKVTAIALLMSALTNVPILLYSGEMSLFLNLALALVLTVLIFLWPHYMFHRMLEKAKEEVLSHVLQLRSKMGFARLDGVNRSLDDDHTTSNMLDLLYLTQYEGNLRNRSTWLVDLEAVVELLVVASIHVVFMELLERFAHI